MIVGFYLWQASRGAPTAGLLGLSADPLPGYANNLRVHKTDAYGNDRSAILGTVAAGDTIEVLVSGVSQPGGEVFTAVVTGTPTTASSVYTFPFTIRQDFEASDEPGDGTAVAFGSGAGADPAGWPDVDELIQVLNLGDDGGTDWQTTLERVLAAAITRVKSDVGLWDEASDAPTVNQSQAALRMAFLMWTSPESPSLGLDPSYRSLLSGQRRRFAVA